MGWARKIRWCNIPTHQGFMKPVCAEVACHLQYGSLAYLDPCDHDHPHDFIHAWVVHHPTLVRYRIGNIMMFHFSISENIAIMTSISTWYWHPIDHQIAYFISAELDDHTLILWWWWWWYLGGWWGEIFSWRWQLARLSSFPLAQSARMVSFSVCGIFPLISSHWGVIYTRASPSSVYFKLIPAAGCAARPSRPSHLPPPWKHQQLIPC